MKNSFFLFIGLLLATNISFGQTKETATLTLEFTITKHNKGKIFMGLFNSDETYMKKRYRSAKAEVIDNKAVITITNLETGTYAYSLFHDVNDNGKMDKNFIGIPKEPYGFSNNLKGRMGPPAFENAKFNFTGDLTLQISIK